MNDEELRGQKPPAPEGAAEKPEKDAVAERLEKQIAQRARAKSTAIEWVSAFLVALAITLVLTQVVFVNAQIPSESMATTIQVGDRVIGYRLAYLNKDPQRLDIVIFKYPDDESELYVKRIIGMPGDVVEIKSGQVYLNGEAQPLVESYVNGRPQGDYGPYTVPQGCYFVMGDNRNSSWDSRYWNNTYVKREKIIGKAGFRIYPDPGKVE